MTRNGNGRPAFAKVFVCLVSSALAINHNRLLFSILYNVAQLFALLQFKVIKGVGHRRHNNTCRPLI
jgi:hypothetical protein